MANKTRTKPRWNYRPPGFRSQVLFKRKKVEELAAICGRNDEGDVTKLSELLNDEDGGLQSVKYIYETNVSVSERRAALQELAKAARGLVSRIDEVDLNTRQAIYSTYPNARPIHEQDGTMDKHELFSQDVEHLERLCGAIERALPLAKVKVGRQKLEHLDFTCHILTKIYESFSGKTFAYNHPHVQENISVRPERS